MNPEPKTIDLRRFNRRMEVWDSYLAILAVLPRNRIEIELEPLERESGSHIQPVDPFRKETEEYATNGTLVWWTVICLDGAPERARSIMDLTQQSNDDDASVLAAEQRFRDLIDELTAKPPFQPTITVLGWWRDGAVLAYDLLTKAVSTAIRLHDTCSEINWTEQRPWNRQFHPRVGIGLSVREAFEALRCAHRDQIWYKRSDRGQSLLGATEEHIRALAPNIIAME